ncbi:ABC transporter substrate-binding protein [Deferribacter abyssi]|uniref:ABC transporter substrate-binding protein n=1 Tax=Deferribacter abyssi TaxID=213806 RepID=UPI003C1DE1FC
MRFLKSILIILTVIFWLCKYSFAYDRVVILSPAAVDIFSKLGLDDSIVGVTRHIKEFKKARKVGSHIKPNIEIIASLNPDLIVYSNEKYFPKLLKSKVDAKFYRYDPRTVEEIFEKILEISKMMDVPQKGVRLVDDLKVKLKKVKKLRKIPKVVYEVMYVPYMVAGEKNIVSDVIRKAGGINLVKINRKLVRYSLEKVLALNPDIYIYQVGPMNKKAVAPEKRLEFKSLKSKFVEVDELLFSRGNSHTIDAILQLNQIFYRWSNE